MFIGFDMSFIIATAVFLFLLGSVMGSFLECMADRTVNGVSIIKKTRSYCPSCGHTLNVLDLVPIWSYLFLGGKCRYCKTKIPPRHLCTEIFTAVSYVLIFLTNGFSINTAGYLFLISVLIPAALSDIETMEVSDVYFIVAAVGGVIVLILKGNWKEGLISAAIGGIGVPLALLVISLILEKILKKESLGGADIKILFAIGIYFGAQKSVLNLLFICIIGLILYVLLKKKGEFPLFPSIVLSALAVMTAGDFIIEKYMSLFV